MHSLATGSANPDLTVILLLKHASGTEHSKDTAVDPCLNKTEGFSLHCRVDGRGAGWAPRAERHL